MKSRLFMSTALALGTLLIGTQGAYARTEIGCVFSWDENAEANIKAHSQHAASFKKVGTGTYEELVGKKLAVRVSGKGGASCTLHHPEKRSIEIKVKKEDFRLDPAGAMPDCNALQATVECKGMETPEAQ